MWADVINNLPVITLRHRWVPFLVVKLCVLKKQSQARTKGFTFFLRYPFTFAGRTCGIGVFLFRSPTFNYRLAVK
jgi:hypothetical protein